MEVQNIKQVSQQYSFDLIIPENVENIIRHLCTKVNSIEWSGILFYTYEGSWENKDLKIKCVDILPMDIGDASHTVFNMSPDVISYMHDHDLLDCECGLVHSHHNMKAFFSGTDQNTLEKEGLDRNHFVSLIVSNSGEYVAAITRKVVVEETVFIKSEYNTFNNENVKLDFDKKVSRAYEQVEYTMLNIIKEGNVTSFKEIDDRLSEIKTTKEAARKSMYTTKTEYYPTGDVDRVRQLNLFDDTYGKYYFNRGSSLTDNFYKGNNKEIESGVDIPEDFVKLTAARLMLSSMTVTNINMFDFEKWANKLDGLYSKIFNDPSSKRYWMEMLCEFVIFDTAPESLCNKYNVDKETLGYELIGEVTYFLQTLPSCEYIDELLNILSGMGYE